MANKKNAEKPILSRDEQHVASRRSFIKWGLAAGAALGVAHWKVLEVLETTGGAALAQTACPTTNRSVHIVNGAGGQSWFQLLWPHNEVAVAARSDSTIAVDQPELAMLATGTDHPLTVIPGTTPFLSGSHGQQVTALMCGSSADIHNTNPDTTTKVGAGADLFATCTSLQAEQPATIPVIAIGTPRNGEQLPYGEAMGRPEIARVSNGPDMVTLFNSVASRGLLATREKADLYTQGYQTFLELQRASDRPTARRAQGVGLAAAALLGRNLADVLQITADDRLRYLNNPATARRMSVDFADSLIVTAKAMRLGLINCAIVLGFSDDPHGAFTGGTAGFPDATVAQTIPDLGRSLDAFMTDLSVEDPLCADGATIAQNLVMSIHGDTPKTPYRKDGWPDGVPGENNWIYVLGAGTLKTGWFGGMRADRSSFGYDPLTGMDTPDRSSGSLSGPSAAAVAYAVAKGDERRLAEHYRGESIAGLWSGG